MRIGTLIGICCALSWLVSPARSAVAYNLYVIPSLGGSAGSDAVGMNASGQVTGYAYTNGNVNYHAFLYSNASMTDLGTLGGTYSYGSAINASGQVTGGGYTTGNSGYHAFLYSNGSLTDLGTADGTGSYGSLINDSGEVVGQVSVANGASTFSDTSTVPARI